MGQVSHPLWSLLYMPKGKRGMTFEEISPRANYVLINRPPNEAD
jgi:hypothetical protein